MGFLPSRSRFWDRTRGFSSKPTHCSWSTQTTHNAISFVYKNIRPLSILIFDQTSGQKQAYLFGLENYRMVQDETYLTEGSKIQQRYTMQHDIYSLGICLSEIEPWKTLVITSPQTEVFDFVINPGIKTATKRANAIKKKLLVMVDEQLAPFVGRRYKSIVERCLTWYDDEDAQGKRGLKVDVGLQYIDDVLQPLREIVVYDPRV